MVLLTPLFSLPVRLQEQNFRLYLLGKEDPVPIHNECTETNNWLIPADKFVRHWFLHINCTVRRRRSSSSAPSMACRLLLDIMFYAAE